MEQKNFIQFIKELMKVTKLHREYQDSDIHYVIDASKDKDGILTIKVKTVEDKEKREFYEWLKLINDELFSEILDGLKEEYNLDELDKMYNSKSGSKEAIEIFKSKAKEIINNKIQLANKKIQNIQQEMAAYKKLF